MAMSLRTADQKSGGNQVSAGLVPMGQPTATIGKRLQQTHDSITNYILPLTSLLKAFGRLFYIMQKHFL